MYKENVRVNEALQYHMAEGEKLNRLKDQLQEENDLLRAEKEMNDMVIKEKVSESKTQKKQIKEVYICVYLIGVVYFEILNCMGLFFSSCMRK